MNIEIKEALQNLANVIDEQVQANTTSKWLDCKTEKPNQGEHILVLTTGLQWYCFTYGPGGFFHDHTHWMRIALPREI